METTLLAEHDQQFIMVEAPGRLSADPGPANVDHEGTVVLQQSLELSPKLAKPRNVIVVVLDSLNRHLLEAYGFNEFTTPNLTRFANRSVKFANHHTGSLPCMPARHDILCGALDFLWRPWGSIEIWEDAITFELRRKGITTQLITDHPHLFESGGENYHTDFSAWDYVRGGEDDPWKTRLDPSWFGSPA